LYEKTKESLGSCPVIHIGDYSYFIHPATDGIFAMDPGLLREIVDGMESIGDFDCDYIIGPEAMGIPFAVLISQDLGIPYNIIRKRKYGVPGEVDIAQYTGYSKSNMYINGIKKGDRVVIVDDVISTGGTMRAIINALKNIIGAEIVDIVVVFEKSGGKGDIEEEFGVKIETLLKVDIVDGKVVWYD
jgi:adenine phosphoribosyltransferase